MLAKHYQVDEEVLLVEWGHVKHAIALHKLNDKVPPKGKDGQQTILHLLRLFHSFSHLSNIVQIMCNLSCVAMTTADCERGFSVLKQIKTPLRNSIGQKNLNNAMLVCIEGSDSFDFHKALKLFASQKHRRVV